MDPYVVIQYKGQEKKSSVAREQGSNPEWNEKFTFRAEYPGSGEQYKITLKIMDKDTFTSDDYIGQATIYVKDLLAQGVQNGTAELHPLKYSVVRADNTYRGEIKVGLTFTPRNRIMGDKRLEDGSIVLHISRETILLLMGLHSKHISSSLVSGPTVEDFGDAIGTELSCCAQWSGVAGVLIAGEVAEVKKLQAKLEGEQTLGRFLRFALHDPVQSHPRLLSLLPAQVQELFSELAMVEEEIGQLDGKVEELKLRLYKEREQTREWKVHMWQLGQQKQLLCRVGNQSVLNEERCRSQNYEALRNLRKERRLRDRRASVGSAADIPRWNFTKSDEETAELSRRVSGRSRNQGNGENDLKPNELSEELLKAHSEDLIQWQIIHNFLQLQHLAQCLHHECLNGIEKLRNLMHQLCDVDLTFLTYKQKLAFWINIYNACIMHAYLEHGLPSTQEKLLAFMNKAALNVGGTVLNALVTEHFILRHPSESKHGPAYRKEMLLRHDYGLGYPEPYLRVYTSDDIVNELERAKLEYLEASVEVTSKKENCGARASSMAHARFCRRYGIIAGMDLQPTAAVWFAEKIDNRVLERRNKVSDQQNGGSPTL
ncbi:hypothetical protein C1H46_029246 [Malus baccata]|uniref:C2 domain-containing protein n=1 Tax=Malus baccata TaxID=106549 RepID=A0A540LF99_MALBA|nr:hypothetical protein C1H46_029246 [Malus baccata]